MAQSIEHDSGPQNTWLRGQAGPQWPCLSLVGGSGAGFVG